MTVDLAKLMALATTLEDRTKKRPSQTVAAWCNKNIKAQADVTQVYLYEDIGDWGITAMDLVCVLQGITGNIELHVNSNGGAVKDGIAMFNAIRNHPSHFTGIVDGFAASAASVVVLACDVVLMEKASRLMIHDAGIGGMYIEGNASQFREAVKEVEAMADLLDDLSNMIAEIYADKAGGDVKSWRTLMANDKWYSADDALAAGLIDGVVGDSKSQDADNRAKPTPVAQTQPAAWDVEGLRNALKGAFA